MNQKNKKSRKKSLAEMNWGSLSALKGYIERNIKGEKILSFEGHTLTTNKAVYMLGPDGLKVTTK